MLKFSKLFRMPCAGFSLAEVLVSLMILGTISAYTIPKVISSNTQGQNSARLKEIIGSLSELTYKAMILRDNALTPATFHTYYATNLNVVKSCPGDIVTQGCWTWAFGSPSRFPFQGMVLPSGATLASFNVCCDLGGGQLGNGIAVDINGSAGPNVYGKDQIDLVISWGYTDLTTWAPYTYKRGTVSVDWSQPLSVALWDTVYK